MKNAWRLLLSALFVAQSASAGSSGDVTWVDRNSDVAQMVEAAKPGDTLTFSVDNQNYRAVYESTHYDADGRVIYQMKDVETLGNSGGPSSGGTPSMGFSLKVPATGALVGAAAAGALHGLNSVFIMTPSRREALNQAENHLRVVMVEAHEAEVLLRNAIASGSNDFAHAILTAESAIEVTPQVISLQRPALESITAESLLHNPEFRARATPVYEKLQSGRKTLRPPLPFERTAQRYGFTSLAEASTQWDRGDYESSAALISIANVFADIFVGLDPFTGVLRDTYQFFTGYNPVTGEKLATWERALSGAMMAATVAPLAKVGVAAVIKASTLIVRRAATLRKGVESATALFRAEHDLQKLGEAGFRTGREIAEYTRFERQVLVPELNSVEDGLHAFRNWSAEAKETFQRVHSELELPPEALEKEARELNISPELLAERRARAIGQMNATPKFTGNSSRIADRMRGIDFSQDVKVVKVDKGTHLYQWQIPGQKAGYNFSAQKESPFRLGIGTLYTPLENPHSLMARELRNYVVEEDIHALESTAGEMFDTFSTAKYEGEAFFELGKNGDRLKNTQHSGGGAKQLFMDPSPVQRIQ